MTVKIDEVEPNIFPHVDDLDARDAGRHVEVFLDVRIEGNHTPVTVKLSYEQASDLATLLEPFRKPSLGYAARSAFRGMMIAVRRSPAPPVQSVSHCRLPVAETGWPSARENTSAQTSLPALQAANRKRGTLSLNCPSQALLRL